QRSRRARRRTALVAWLRSRRRAILLLAVAAGAYVLSFAAFVDLARADGIEVPLAYLFPFCGDILWVASLDTALEAKGKWAIYPWLVFAACCAGSMVANAAHPYTRSLVAPHPPHVLTGWVAWLTSGVPAVALMLTATLHKVPSRERAEREAT